MSIDPLSYFLRWKPAHHLQERGVLTGANEHQEWLLPNWWHCYKEVCQEPVTFIDFGMSKSARIFCAKRGEVLDWRSFPHYFEGREKVPSMTAKFWERIYLGNLWQARKVWLSKPLALLQTSYKWTIWIDLDCEVKKPLTDLFELADNESGLSLTPTARNVQKSRRVLGLLRPGEKSYNSGVVAFRHGSSALFKWSELTVKRHVEFLGDENSLATALWENNFTAAHLPLIYNWPFCYGDNPEAKIVHFFTSRGRQALLHSPYFSQALLED